MHNIKETQEDLSGDIFLGALSKSVKSGQNEWEVDVHINHVEVTFMLDTGAQTNIMTEGMFKQCKKGENLSKTNVKLTSFSGHKVENIGKVCFKVEHKGEYLPTEFIVVKSPVAKSILGLRACENMNLIRRIASVSDSDVRGTNSSSTSTSVMLDKYTHVFEGLGCLEKEHHIEIDPSVPPVIHPPRKVPIALRLKMKVELQRMERLGVIQRVDRPTDWVSSIVCVTKSDASLRICLDPRDLNNAIKREHYQLPTVEEITPTLTHAKVFSVLDASAGFWQIKLDEESSHLCTFNTPFGRYRYLRLPFGICSAPEVFHKNIGQLFDDIEGVATYIDDILVWGSNQEEHDERLKLVLERAGSKNLTLNRKKCKVSINEVPYLGHLLSEEGIKPDPAKVKAMRDMPEPSDKKALMRFLGVVTYVSKFIPNLSTVAAPLRDLIKKDSEWVWDENGKKCFERLKTLISEQSVLKFYDMSKNTTLQVDASQHGLGAALMQEGQPVAYASRTLTKTEKAYAQIEKEMLAVVFGCERFNQYVYGQTVCIETDHRPLVTISKKPLSVAPARIQRFLLRLQKYSFSLVYKPGKEMYLADTLSRAALDINPEEDTIVDTESHIHSLVLSLPVSDQKHIQMLEATVADSTLQTLKQVVKSGWPELRHDVPEGIRHYWPYRDEITEAEGLMFKGQKLIISQSMRTETLQAIHQGHLGMEKCKSRAREVLYWPNINIDIEEMVRKCSACVTHSNSQQKEPLTPHNIPNGPWLKVGMDLFQSNGRNYLLVVDYYSKYIEVCLLKGTKSSDVIQHIKSIFARHGIPYEVMSDNGPQFDSSDFANFAKQWSFKHTTSSPMYPKSNGLAERSIQTVKNMLDKQTHDGQDPYLGLLALRNTPISSDVDSPAQLLMNRRLRSTIPGHRSLYEASDASIHQRLEQRQHNQKRYHDRGAKVLPPLHVGDAVRVKTPKDHQWLPATVTGKTELPRSYVVETPDGGSYRRNRSHLKTDTAETVSIPQCPSSPTLPLPEIAEPSAQPSMPPAVHTAHNPDSDTNNCDSKPTIVSTRSGRVIHKPQRYQ